MSRRQPPPVHPVLFAVFPVLFLYVSNLELVHVSELAVPTGLILIGTCLLWAIWGLICREWHKAAALTSFSLALFFLYGHVYKVIVEMRINEFLVGRHKYLAITWMIIVLVAGSR